jgi:hypothetical protein
MVKEDNSLVLKLEFEGNQIPDKVLFGFISYKVRMYNPPPLQCHRCQQPGHLSSGCTARECCLLCAGSHSKNVCISTTHKCANCGKPLIASNKECQYNIQAKAIDTVKRDGMSYDSARRQTNLMLTNHQPTRNTNKSLNDQVAKSLPQSRTLKETPIQTTSVQADVHRSQGSYLSSLPCQQDTPTLDKTYSQVSQSSRSNNPNHSLNQPASEQLPMFDAIETLTNFIKNEIQKLSTSICKFLKEIIPTDFSKKNRKEKELLTIQHH